jgi:TetR/AcrR family transcriptional repressor of lmrAB and yxaGH operons
MIERTVVLLAKKGLQGASFSQILEQSGAPRGSLYHHFPGGKDELVLAAVALAGDQAMAVLERLAGRPAPDIAEAFIALWRLVLTRSDFGAGCAVAAVTVAAETPALRQEAGAVFRRWRTRLAELLEAGGVPAGRGTAMGASLISACEGGVILARGEGSLEPFELVTSEQLRQIRAASDSD